MNNRPIKFRAWDKVNEKWLEIESIAIARNNMPTNITATNGNVYQIQNDGQIELVQFTGLLDANDVEIHEGDLLRPSHEKHHDKVGEVRAEPGGWQIFTRRNWPDWYQDFPMRSVQFGDMQYEVIGNVYENPELLTN